MDGVRHVRAEEQGSEQACGRAAITTAKMRIRWGQWAAAFAIAGAWIYYDEQQKSKTPTFFSETEREEWNHRISKAHPFEPTNQ